MLVKFVGLHEICDLDVQAVHNIWCSMWYQWWYVLHHGLPGAATAIGRFHCLSIAGRNDEASRQTIKMPSTQRSMSLFTLRPQHQSCTQRLLTEPLLCQSHGVFSSLRTNSNLLQHCLALQARLVAYDWLGSPDDVSYDWLLSRRNALA